MKELDDDVHKTPDLNLNAGTARTCHWEPLSGTMKLCRKLIHLHSNKHQAINTE